MLEQKEKIEKKLSQDKGVKIEDVILAANSDFNLKIERQVLYDKMENLT
jgi:hypothetical protein